jgi:hypothetical protein
MVAAGKEELLQVVAERFLPQHHMYGQGRRPQRGVGR